MIRLAIADDHAVVREGVRQIFSTTADIIVAEEAADADALKGLLRRATFDALLMDLNMPGGGTYGVELIGFLVREYQDTPIIVFSMHKEGPVVAQTIKAGAKAYVSKGSPSEVLIKAVRLAVRGESFLDPAVVNALLFDTMVPESDDPTSFLSTRELQILKMITTGQHLGEIADKLFLSAKTVSTHKTNLMRKLGISNNADLIRFAVKHDLLPD